jgi:hypothetical protein
MRRDDCPEAHSPDHVAIRGKLLVGGGDRETPHAELACQRPHARQPLARPEASAVDGLADLGLDLSVERFRARPVELEGERR